MKKILIILFVVFSYPASATNYYVKTGGSDIANGLTDGTAWATIGRVNTIWAAGTFAPGDNIYFNRGNVFTDATLTPTESGTLGNRITIGAYGVGADPIISGFTTIVSWTNEGNGIYSGTVASSSAETIVSLDGTNKAMGREPETGWTIYDSFSGTTQITDATLNSSVIDWTGAEVVVRLQYYAINRGEITNHSGNTITFSPTVWSMEANCGFFIQNNLRTLDTYGEWYFDQPNSKFYMYFGSEIPANHSVRVASRNYGANIADASYITISNISFEGFYDSAINLDATPAFTLQDCDISFCFNGVLGSVNESNTSPGCVITKNTLTDINSCGIKLGVGNTTQQFNNATISYNTLTNIGVLHGMGEPHWIQSHIGIFYSTMTGTNTNSVIRYNILKNIGYVGIEWMVTNTEVNHNIVENYCLILADGGGIYTYNDAAATRTGYVHHNIVLNGYGDLTGTPYTETSIAGLYSDGSSNGIRWEDNVVANNIRPGSYGYLGNGNANGTIKDNTFYNNANNIRISGETSHANCAVTGNIFFCRSITQSAFLFYSGSGNLTASCITDFNYYSSPLDNDADGHIINWTSTYNNYTLAEWQSHRSQDANSHGSPRTISTAAEAHLVYNDTTIAKNYTLSAGMVDLANNPYSGTISIDPWESLVLLGAGTITPSATKVNTSRIIKYHGGHLRKFRP